MKNKICVIFTGGTIGSSCRDGVVDLDGGSAGLLIDTYKKRGETDMVFEEFYPVNMLSENVRISDVKKIKACIESVNADEYDGIIVTHGTDTLCFAANLFSQIFCDIKIPLVFVSSLFPLKDERSNGAENFAGAVALIRENLPGVYVAFKNAREDCKIHLASRLTDAQQLNGNFYSVLNVPFGFIKDGKFRYVAHRLNPSPEQIRESRPGCALSEPCGDIVIVKARALLDFSFYRFENRKPKAIVVEPYHSGTVCTAGSDTNFLSFLQYCKKLDIPVVLGPVDSGANIYAGMTGIKDDCIFSCDVSFEMTVVKVMLALGSRADIGKVLSQNNFFEKLR